MICKLSKFLLLDETPPKKISTPTVPTTTPLTLETALDIYWNLGWTVFPVKQESKGKILMEWKQYQTNPPDSETMKNWFYNNEHGIPLEKMNVTLLNGPASENFFSIDFDRADLARLIFPKFDDLIKMGLISKTNKGYHLFFTTQEDSLSDYLSKNVIVLNWYTAEGKEEEALSIRIQNSLTVLPPSIHPISKKPYLWLSDIQTSRQVTIPTGLEFLYYFEQRLRAVGPQLEKTLRNNIHKQFLSACKEVFYTNPAIPVEPYQKPQFRVRDKNNKRQFQDQGVVAYKSRYLVSIENQTLSHALGSESTMKPCAKMLIEIMNARKRHYTHKVNFFLANELYHNGYRRTVIHDVFSQATKYEKKFRRVGYNQAETETQYQQMLVDNNNQEAGLRYKRMSCVSLQEPGGNYKICMGATCPFFKYTPLGVLSPQHEGNITFIKLLNHANISIA